MMIYVVLGVVGLVIAVVVYSIAAGNARANQFAKHYGVPASYIIQMYDRWHEICRSTGLSASLRSFEGALRIELAKNNPGVRNIQPLHCTGMDSLDPSFTGKA